MTVGVAPSLGPTYGGMNTFCSAGEKFSGLSAAIVIAVLLGVHDSTEDQDARDTFDFGPDPTRFLFPDC